jgi:hypothetical protein
MLRSIAARIDSSARSRVAADPSGSTTVPTVYATSRACAPCIVISSASPWRLIGRVIRAGRAGSITMKPESTARTSRQSCSGEQPASHAAGGASSQAATARRAGRTGPFVACMAPWYQCRRAPSWRWEPG